jgi:hypothetical protein
VSALGFVTVLAGETLSNKVPNMCFFLLLKTTYRQSRGEGRDFTILASGKSEKLSIGASPKKTSAIPAIFTVTPALCSGRCTYSQTTSANSQGKA